jgi:putative oxidoreductase
MTSLKKLLLNFFALLDKLEPLWWLFIRLWIAGVFFRSGLVKIHDFDTAIALFADEYKVPLLPPVFAAYSAAFFETVCPVFLTLGLATRFAALPLLAMTAVIEFTYIDNVEHYYWAILLAGLILHGAGKISLDEIIKRKFSR